MFMYIKEVVDCFPKTFFFQKDREGKFTSTNKLFLEHLGLKNESQIIGKTDYDFYPKYIADVFIKDDLEVLKTNQPLKNRLELLPQGDYQLNWVITHKFPMQNEEKETIGLIGFTSFYKDSVEVILRNEKLHKVISYIQNHFHLKITLSELAGIMNVSEKTLERYFKKYYGTTPKNYLKKVRIHAACHALKNTNDTISQISLKCGFFDQSHFTREFKSVMSCTPFSYRKC